MTGTNTVRSFVIWMLCIVTIHLPGCLGAQHVNRYQDNICEIFREKRSWYRSAHASYRRWGIPIPVMMAIVHQESRFDAKAKPPRTTCLCIFPGPRPSTAYGYSQALDETWEKYKQFTGNRGADRDDFGDSVDFIGWYCSVSHTRCGIARNDAYNLYIAYHEGHGGFLRKTYQKKEGLRRVASKVGSRTRMYEKQLASCEREFQERGGCCLWPF
jgi:hypothetical protein